MKKGLLLLPLVLAGLMVTSCGEEKGGNGGNGGNGGSGDVVYLDFTQSSWKDDKITPYIEDMDTMKTFEYGGMTYNDIGCHSDYNSYNSYYALKAHLQLAPHEGSKTTIGDLGDRTAFVGNANSYGKKIKKVEIKTAPSNSGKVTFTINFGGSAFTAGSRSGTALSGQDKVFTQEANGDYDYFAVSCYQTGTATYDCKNGEISYIKIFF